MRAYFIPCFCFVTVMVSGCSSAKASDLDPSNPLHCAGQFISYSLIAKAKGDERLAKGFDARATWYAVRARSSSPERLTDEELREVEEMILETSDGGLALATECMKRQDADPEFKKLVSRK